MEEEPKPNLDKVMDNIQIEWCTPSSLMDSTVSPKVKTT